MLLPYVQIYLSSLMIGNIKNIMMCIATRNHWLQKNSLLKNVQLTIAEDTPSLWYCIANGNLKIIMRSWDFLSNQGTRIVRGGGGNTTHQEENTAFAGQPHACLHTHPSSWSKCLTNLGAKRSGFSFMLPMHKSGWGYHHSDLGCCCWSRDRNWKDKPVNIHEASTCIWNF